MNKAIKTGGIVLGIILAAALIIFIFFPGLPVYVTAKSKYKDVNRTVPDFETAEVPADFKSYSLKGVSFKVPADWEGNSPFVDGTVTSYRSPDEKGRISVIKNDRASYDLIQNSEYKQEFGYWEGYRYSEDDYRHFFDKLGCEYPDLWFEEWFVWLHRDGFTAKDCLKLRGKDMKVFKELAAGKSSCFKLEEPWRLDGDDFYGYVGISSMGKGSRLWNFCIVPNGCGDTYYNVMVKCEDETTARQIISSVRLK